MRMRSRPWQASRALFTLAAALLLTGLASRPAGAASTPWQLFNPSGLSIRLLQTDPSAPGTLYLAFLNDGLFKSTDSGRTWSRSGLQGQNVYALVTDPYRPGALYALTGSDSIFGSTDRGASWRRLGGPTPEGDSSIGLDLAIGGGRTLYVALGRELFSSSDLGKTWKRILDSEAPIQSVAADPVAPGTVYVSTSAVGGGVSIPAKILKTRNGGLNWQEISGDLIPPDLGHRLGFGTVFLGVAATNPPTVYAAVFFQGVFKSTKGGASWSRLPLGNPGKDLYPTALVLDALDPRTLYVAHGGLAQETPQVAVSRDAGATWQSQARGLFAGNVKQLAADSSTGTLFAAGIFSGLRSSTAGRPWKNLLHSVSEASFSPSPGKVRFRPGNPSTVYTLFAGRYWKSTDAGKTWSAFSISPGSPYLSDLAFDPADPDVLYGAARTGIFRSGDGGASWVALGKVEATTLVLPRPGTILAGGCGIARSLDGGTRWRQVLPCQGPGLLLGRGVEKLWVDPKNNDRIYAQTLEYTQSGPAHHFYRSLDGGATWPRLLSNASALALDPFQSDTLYAFQGEGLIKSTDNGRTWRRTGSSGNLLGEVSDLLFDPADPETLYATTLAGLLFSQDGGKTWDRVPQESSSVVNLQALFPHPKVPHLFYGMGSNGVYEARIEP